MSVSSLKRRRGEALALGGVVGEEAVGSVRWFVADECCSNEGFPSQAVWSRVQMGRCGALVIYA